MGGRFAGRAPVLRTGGTATEALLAWLFRPDIHELSLQDFIRNLGEQLREAGLPVDRILTGALTAHPQVAIIGIEWLSSGELHTRMVSNQLAREDRASGSPFAALRSGLDEICEPLARPDASFHFNKLRTLRDEGYTYYYARSLPFGSTERHAISFCTRDPSGFSEDAIETLRVVSLAMAGRLEVFSLRHTLSSLLQVYLGRDAATRVLAGDFERGSGTEMDAAIWFCDLRGFTSMSDRLAAHDVVTLLDQVFERVGQAVVERGGTILKFIGDAVLAIFPCDEAGGHGACDNALAASKAAVGHLEDFNRGRQERGLEPVGMGVALHHGKVYYGNIGAAERLDFTVIGAAVNEVCRLESLCKEVGQDVLMTDAFARTLGCPTLVSLGEHRFKGVGRPVEVFGLEQACKVH